MRNLLVALVGFLVGGAAIAAVALALPRTTTTPPPTHTHQATGAAASAVVMNVSATRLASGARPVKLTIQHVQRGCHVWSNGKTTGSMMRLHLTTGQKLAILEMDVDVHQLTQFSGARRTCGWAGR